MKKTRIVLWIVCAILLVAGLALGGCTNQTKTNSNANGKPGSVLSTPTNVSYNDKTYTLTWDAVKHADSYKVEIDGTRYDVEGTSYSYLPSHKVTSFKVQAQDSTRTYKPSEWSDEVQYTVSLTDGLTRLAVNVYVGDKMGSLELRNIVSIAKKTDNVVSISAVFSDGLVHEFEYHYENEVASLRSVIENNNYTKIRSRGAYDVKDYDTAGSYLKKTVYSGTLEEYRTAGYTISVVSSQAYEYSDNLIGLYGIFKVTNGTETKYFNVILEFPLEASAREGARYTQGVEMIDPSRVEEIWCHELQGDFIDALELYVEGFQKD